MKQDKFDGVKDPHEKKKIVLVTGTYDGLHPGHINFFTQAKQLADILVVIVARDKTVKEIKGKLPQRDEQARFSYVKKLAIVDQVIMGSLDDPYQTVVDLKPDVVALGYDQTVFTDKLTQELDKRGCQAQIVRLQPYFPDKYKSSKI
jgi:FAD synthetase